MLAEEAPRWLQQALSHPAKQPRWLKQARKHQAQPVEAERRQQAESDAPEEGMQVQTIHTAPLPVRDTNLSKTIQKDANVVCFNIGSSSESEAEEAEPDPECIADERSSSVPGPKTGPERERRDLNNSLWWMMRHWTPQDLVDAEKALAAIHIRSLDRLALAVAIDLNGRLREKGLSPFAEGTLEQLKRCLGDGKRSRVLLEDSSEDPGDGGACDESRTLYDLLWRACPSWSPGDLLAAARKLEAIGICNLAKLWSAVAAGDGAHSLNSRLRQEGLRTFSSRAISAFQRHLIEVYGRSIKDNGTPGVGSLVDEDSWLHYTAVSDQHQPLHSLHSTLRACKPDWSPSEVMAAEYKLQQLDITTVAKLTDAVAGNLNRELRAAGLKAFSTQTIRELQRHLAQTRSETEPK